jgi:hypothetical protein
MRNFREAMRGLEEARFRNLGSEEEIEKKPESLNAKHNDAPQPKKGSLRADDCDAATEEPEEAPSSALKGSTPKNSVPRT